MGLFLELVIMDYVTFYSKTYTCIMTGEMNLLIENGGGKNG